MSRCPRCLEDQANPVICPVCQWDKRNTGSFAPALPPGTILNRQYWLGLPLGHGGFGITYLAWDRTLDCKVVIKEYLPTKAGIVDRHENGSIQFTQAEIFEKGLARFRQEAQALARFAQEPGIMPVMTFFEERDTGYFVMPYFPGSTIEQWVKQRGTVLALAEALDLLQPIFIALRMVHAKSMIHRDISPDNIYITADRKAKLIDFGAARCVIGTETQNLTTILKPGFAPPEQYQRQGRQGPWTDIYALAATLYWIITGETPVDAMERQTAVQRRNKDPLRSPAQCGVLLPKKAEVILLKALHLDLEKRYQRIDNFQKDLFATLSPPSLNPTPLWRDRLLSPIPVGVYVTICVTLAFYLLLGWLTPVSRAGVWSLAAGLAAGLMAWWVNQSIKPIQPPLRPFPAPQVHWVLVCTHGEVVGSIFPISSGEVIIGRDPQQANLILNNPQVSGRHARLRLSGEGMQQAIILEDLNSRNGTYVSTSLAHPITHIFLYYKINRL